jgi:hypothetical protein
LQAGKRISSGTCRCVAFAEHGLSICVKGQGMIVTDGVYKVKCTEIHRTLAPARAQSA